MLIPILSGLSCGGVFWQTSCVSPGDRVVGGIRDGLGERKLGNEVEHSQDSGGGHVSKRNESKERVVARCWEYASTPRGRENRCHQQLSCYGGVKKEMERGMARRGEAGRQRRWQTTYLCGLVRSIPLDGAAERRREDSEVCDGVEEEKRRELR